MKKEKTGGREKGTPNKSTASIREAISEIVSENLPQLKMDIKSLAPKDRIKAITDLASYVLPKLKATDITISDEAIPSINIAPIEWVD